jgi:hypothetical protein
MPMPRSIARDGRGDLGRLSVHADLALVRAVQPVEDRHQRRLAGPVLAQQGVNLTLPQIEVDPVVRDDRTEPLGYSAEFESGCF